MYLLGAGGGGVALSALIKGLIGWLSGASGRERDRNSNLITQRRTAIEEMNVAVKEREEADDKRRNSDEYVSILRRQLIESGQQPRARPRNHPITKDLDTA